MVFSHPNHELAVLGFVERYRPRLLFLTDGGVAARVEETRRGLARAGVLDRASFLDYTEGAFYRALLDRDARFFLDVAARVRELLGEEPLDEVFCDAIELYNPVHDICRPIVAAACRGRAGTEAFELPLIHQVAGPGERYDVQRVPSARREARRELLRLTEAEVGRKLRAADEVYTTLRAQMGGALAGLPASHFALEEAVLACTSVPRPGPEPVLRYEWRGALLHERGEIDRVITFADHYLPVATALFESR